MFQTPVASLWSAVPPDYHLQVVTAVIMLSGVFLIVSRFFQTEKVIPSRELKSLKLALDVVGEVGDRKVLQYGLCISSRMLHGEIYYLIFYRKRCIPNICDRASLTLIFTDE